MSGTVKSMLDNEITKVFFACNILFSMTEQLQFCRVIQLSNEATHHQVVKPSVEYCWTVCTTNSHRIWGTTKLVQDGWSNIHNEHLVAYKLHPRYQGEHLTQKQMEDVCEYLITSREMWCTTWLCRTGTSVIVSSWFFSIHWEDFSSLYFVTGSSEDFVIWIIDVSNGRIQLFMCERCESLMWLLNKRYLQNISVITELEKNGRKTNIKYYFTFMFVIYKYTNSDIMVIHDWF